MMEHPETTGAMDYEQFRRSNSYKVNRSLNRVLWFSILTGPAIALGILGGVFKQTSYLACVAISCAMALMAGSNSLILRKKPYSYVPSLLALVAADCLLCYMNLSHVSVRLTWFVVPFLSLLLCDMRIYLGASVMNYVVMGVGTWLEAGHYAAIRTDFETPLMGFINIFAGCTIEALIMFAAGFALGKATSNYYRQMIGRYSETLTQQRTMQEQLDIMESMAEIYDYVNLIDFVESTEMSLREETLHKLAIAPEQDHTHMTQGLRGQIAPDMLDEFWQFTNIKTVPTRLVNRKSISGEFVSNEMGWFRAQYIRVSHRLDGKPDAVIFTVQNIDADKRREEQLIRVTLTDELTRMFNRRCYDEDISCIRVSGMDRELAVISADINGLKPVNDRLGHAAGDELIRGAAFCMASAIGVRGKVYRTGGDEFMAIVRCEDCEALLDEIRAKASAWQGKMVDGVSLSLGFASHAAHPSAGIEELERLADTAMYEDKARFYRESGRGRRLSPLSEPTEETP